MVQLRKSLTSASSKHGKSAFLSYAPSPVEHVISRLNADGHVNLLSNLDPSVVFKITGVAARIWPLLDGKTTCGDILKKLKTEYPDTEGEVALLLLKKFISGLREASLVE